MANTSFGGMACPPPFVDLADFPYTGGCTSIRASTNSVVEMLIPYNSPEWPTVCSVSYGAHSVLPAVPLDRLGIPGWYAVKLCTHKTKLMNLADFNRLTGVANWLNVGSTACTALLLLSLLVLPVQKTSRHYLTVCLLIAVGFMSVGISATQKRRA